MANQGRHVELGLSLQEKNENNNQDNVNNPETLNNQWVPPVVPTRPVRDVAVPLTTNMASSIRKPPPGGRFELKQGMNHRATGILDVDQVTAINAKLDAMQHNIAMHFKQMSLNQELINMVQQISNWSGVCDSGAHETEQCEANPNYINYLGNAQNYGNTYNPSWRNHPNFSWDGNQNQNQAQWVNQYRSQGAGQQYQNPNQCANPSAPKGGMTNKELLQKLMTEIGTKINTRIDKQDENIKNIQMSQMSLEKQVAQEANPLNLRPQGGLPGDTEPNPKQLHAITPKKRDTETSTKENKVEEADECFGMFLSILKQVHINLPLVDILQGIPEYAKYVKDIVANKRRLTEYETIALTEECSSRIQNRLPKELKDSGSSTVQITIRQNVHTRGLCDLGASINLIPLSIYQKLGLGSPKRTNVILQLIDRSIARPEKVVEDVLVQVGSLIFLVDFVVLDFEPNMNFHSF
ncbi:hypothetical protein R3W88_029987 [Solanum pinnatisectum]|uniref:Uncharacterized protein n=1 Tax=Solanum pinnatisectum TaxID=50273 RepID=A0AAV9KAD6_9SOLN|nr:hypothetical protein R3W88_029987 [Solanum pinnatisectum]